MNRNSIRASAYPAIDAVTTTRRRAGVAAAKEFIAQRSTGFCPPVVRMTSYARPVGSCGHSVGGAACDSPIVLIDVITIHSSGSTNTAVSAITSSQNPGVDVGAS